MRVLLLSCVLLAAATEVFGQQTVFNVPSADVLDHGKLYTELDFAYRHSDSAKAFTPRLVVGLGHQIEAGVNIVGIQTAAESQTTISPAIKWKLYDGHDNGWSFLIGNNLFIPVQNRAYNVGTWLYAEFTKAWNTNTRASFGGYYASRNVFAPFHRAGGQLALEQSLTKRLTVAADWFTGKSGVGYLTTGATVKLSTKLIWYVGYQVGNADVRMGNHQVLTEVGWNCTP